VWAAYAVDVLSFVISAALLAAMRPVAPSREAEPPSLRRIREGMAYAWGRKDVLGTYLVDLAAMFFAFPFALFPFIAQQFGAPWSLGLLYSAEAVGALIATATSGWTSRVHHHGRAVVLAAMVWGAAIAAVGLSPAIGWVLAALVVAGGADMVSGLFRMLIWNQTVPDHLRGRMAGIELLSYSVGPQLGQIRASGVAQLTSLRASLVSGGLACVVACGLLAAALPALWGFDSRTDENAARERAARSRPPSD
jgi:MFS family permease